MSDFMDEHVDDRETFFYCVSIYKIDRAYGGPEEGGWYYNTGEPVLEFGMHTRCFVDYSEALDYERVLRETLIPELNEGRRPISSVLSEGQFAAYIDENEYPAAYPKERPHYE
jgi:hypothetical protein